MSATCQQLPSKRVKTGRIGTHRFCMFKPFVGLSSHCSKARKGFASRRSVVDQLIATVARPLQPDRAKGSPYRVVALFAIEEVGVDAQRDVGIAVSEHG